MSAHRISVDGGKYTFVRVDGREDVKLIDRSDEEPFISWVHEKDAPAIASMMVELDAARVAVRAAEAQVSALETRQQELLPTIVRLTNETPFPDEIKGWEAQRAALVSEVGSLRARVAELERAAKPAGDPQWRETWEVGKP